MLLQALNDLYARLEQDPDYQIAPSGFSLQKVGFCVVLAADGALVNIEDLRRREGKKLVPVQRLVPGQASRTNGVTPYFLWDNTKYLLGYDNKAKDDSEESLKLRKRALETWYAFVEKHLAINKVIDHRDFSAVCRFLKHWQPEHAENFEFLSKMNNYGLFRIQGQQQFVHELPEVQAWWASQAKASTEGAEDKAKKKNAKNQAVEGLCLVTGERAILARLHQPMIKGVHGDKAAVALASFNKNAYESYGLEKCYNSPVSKTAAFKYGTALNALLDGPMQHKHKQFLGEATVAFWTEKPSLVEDVFSQFLSDGSSVREDDSDAQDETQRQKLQIFLEALRKGSEAYGELADDVNSTNFYVLALSPNAARVSVRFFQRSSISEFLDHLRKHQQDMKLEGRPETAKSKGDPEFLPTWMLLAQTARESKEIPPILAGGLLRAILTGAQYPQALYDAVLRRIRADREVNYARACIIKGFLVRNHHMEVPMSLDIARQDPGYRLGRLFAALEKTQMDGLGMKINATIRDRYYSSASATPGVVFPRLLRTYPHHLAKMEGGFKVNREKLVQEILDPLTSFPTHLKLEDQGLFALGYYQQTQDFYRSKKDKAENETA